MSKPLYALRDVVSNKGNVFRVLTRTRMPRIPDEFLTCAIYMYNRPEDAQAGNRYGGSGFLLVVPSVADPNVRHLYAVTNRHVVLKGGVVPRLTTVDGGTEILPLSLENWIYDKDAEDIAICYLRTVKPPYKYLGVPDSFLLRTPTVQAPDVGPGDEVFMVGRFMDHDGVQSNAPAVRFGHVSIMPDEPIIHDNVSQRSFLVEAFSLSGFSGAPVFVHFPPGNWRDGGIKYTQDWRFLLLGVDCGHLFQEARVTDRKSDKDVFPDWRVKLNTGLMVVVPSWVLREWLDKDPLAASRREEDRRIAEEQAGRQLTEADVQ